MSRLLFFVVLAFILGYWWSSRRQRGQGPVQGAQAAPPAPAPAPAPPLMLPCVVCGSHVPAGEARHSPKGPCCSEACAKKAWS